MTAQRRFRTVVAVDPTGRTVVPIPFDPDDLWGEKSRHPVRGSIAGRAVRGYIEKKDAGPVLVLGPTWTSVPLTDGEQVDVVLEAEGP